MRSNWQYAVMAFVMAVTLWYMVTGRERVEVVGEVRLEFKGIPQNLVVREGLVNKVSVRVRGPKGLVRVMTARDMSYAIDLSNLKRGTNIVPLTAEKLPEARAFEVVEITPSRLTLEVDAIVEKDVPVAVDINGTIPVDVRIDKTEVTPAKVHLRGPETLVARIDRVKVAVAAPGLDQARTMEVQATPTLPEATESTPPTVSVRVETALRMKETTLKREVAVQPPRGLRVQVAPRTVTLLLEMPASVAADAEALRSIRVYAEVPEGAGAGQERLPVRVDLPDRVRLKDISPDAVNVTFRK
ncbi:CdaR family protein [Nitratidesulfovibrio liaohensis]|uniref:YbbR-like domain-containing protein n=1 Tax=Nitratidesulfovibrio liaohensis TaxID=2604158 RepID=A0ABY9R1G3_9BACT|nr:CdaR family protein [Nitratidesulfovibrio liaohensis]WMW65588.1 YbbR-like domain-containing protein [Nitratidesulfovibrio liaohensis]